MKLDAHKFAKKYDGCVLLCYERAGEFCHRNIVASWLRYNGYDATEFTGKRNIQFEQTSLF